MRIRSIWPGFWNSLTIAKLDYLGRLYFIGLWNFADDEGRGICDHRLHKAALFPLDDAVTPGNLGALADDLEALGLIARYTAGDVRYYSVSSWDEYQHPNRPKESKLPAPPNAITKGAVQMSGGRTPPSGELGSREGKGREGSRKGEEEQQKPRARALGEAPAQAVRRLTRRVR